MDAATGIPTTRPTAPAAEGGTEPLPARDASRSIDALDVPADPAIGESSAALPPGSQTGAPNTAFEDADAQAPQADLAEAATSEQAVLDSARLEQGLDWAYCGPPDNGAPFRLAAPPPSDQPIELSADGAELYHLEERAVLSGDVRISRGDYLLEADRASYWRDTGIAQAQGNAYLEQPGLRLLGRFMEIDLIKRTGHVEQAEYRLVGMNARGSAQHAEFLDSARSHYDQISYTTCPAGSDAWRLEAEQLDIDRDLGEGVARHAKLRVAGVPILYAPYFSFPLDNQRKSGFLIPSFGNSNKLGFDISSPYYVNIAPDMDATLIPRVMSKRGFMLGGEFRYLTASQRGSAHGEIIPDDRQSEDGRPRGGIKFLQEGHFGPRWASDINFNLVSDDTYLEDFGSDLSITSTRNLEQRADLRYLGTNWQLLGRLQRFQTVDSSIAPEDQPYARLPQLLFTYRQANLWQGIEAKLDAENVYFEHKHKVHGNRLAFRPSVSLPLRRSYGHLIPRASLNHASYWLIDQTAGLGDNPNSTVPSLSLDGGLVFERPLNWLGQASRQTLEPRLFYLYTPYQDQDDLPVFDSAELDFSFASLFRENRFTGRDRIGDANQLTVALTSRTLDDASGRELLRGSIGQILYFQDRQVQISGSPDDPSSSFMAGELAARLSEHWSTRASMFWDPNRGTEQIRKTSAGIYYHGDRGRLVNLTYRLNRSELDSDDTDYEDADLSFYWPVRKRLDLVGRWLYSLRHDQTMEAFAGVQYGECCWRVRAIVRNFVNSPDEEANLSFMLQFELAGLGAFGSDIDDFLTSGIYGYDVE